MSKEQFIREAFFLPPAVIEYHVSQSLKELFPEKACIEIEGGYFDVESYANAQHCLLTQKTFIHNQMMTYWLEPGPEATHHGGPGPEVMHPGGAIVRTPRGRPRAEPLESRQRTTD